MNTLTTDAATASRTQLLDPRRLTWSEAALAAYAGMRLPATAAIVHANRGNGPEQCMQLAEQRAPDGFHHIDDVFAPGELQAIADRYKVLTGLKPKL